MPMILRRVAALILGLCLSLIVTGCGAAPGGPAAAPIPPQVPGEAGPPDLANVTIPEFIMPLITGGVSLPRRALTPGAVATTNATTVCAMSAHESLQSVPAATQTTVWQEYGFAASPQFQHKYQIDYLVPLFLGGATTVANLWPAALKGVGFFQKIKLDHVLRDLVCHRSIPLVTAQQDLERNWYVAWLRYVVAAGRA